VSAFGTGDEPPPPRPFVGLFSAARGFLPLLVTEIVEDSL
jgi:hypothetical protein